MAPKELDKISAQEIQEEILLKHFVGEYQIRSVESIDGNPVEVERRDPKEFIKIFANLIKKHGLENVNSVALQLDEQLTATESFLSIFKPLEKKDIAEAFKVSEEFASNTDMEIKNSKLTCDPKATAELYKQKYPQPPTMVQRLKTNLQRHITGRPTAGNEMTSPKPSIQLTYNPMRRESNNR